MKKFFVFMIAIMFLTDAYSDCVATNRVYTSCNSGYYLSNGDCFECPKPGTESIGGTSGITGCFIPAGVSGKDESGPFTYTADCYYVN